MRLTLSIPFLSRERERGEKREGEREREREREGERERGGRERERERERERDPVISCLWHGTVMHSNESNFNSHTHTCTL